MFKTNVKNSKYLKTMLQSKFLGKTQKEAPKGAETVNQILLTRGGFVDQVTSGVYTLLPLGFAVYKKIEEIIREEMNKLSAQEVFMPAMVPKKFWDETGRWDSIDPPLFKFKDRHQKYFGLGSTHEEIITDLVRKNINSYKDLPFSVYQIQNKFRNEMRATSGLLRVREFIMKDLYSFHRDEKDRLDFYEKVSKSYFAIFKRCSLKVLKVEADPGTIGGSSSHEFVALSETGEDKVAVCAKCKFAGNVEVVGNIKKCPKCGAEMDIKFCIECGHVFNLGTKYSKAMKAVFVDKDGKSKSIVMGCYGIGLGRLLATAVEVNHDKNGIIWPKSLTPFMVHVLMLGNDEALAKSAEAVYNELLKSGVSVLLDEREESIGVKFADADLIGISIQVIVSKRNEEKGAVEIKTRADGKSKFVKKDQLAREIKCFYEQK